MSKHNELIAKWRAEAADLERRAEAYVRRAPHTAERLIARALAYTNCAQDLQQAEGASHGMQRLRTTKAADRRHREIREGAGREPEAIGSAGDEGAAGAVD